VTRFLFWTIIVDVPIIKGPRVVTTRSKAFKGMLWWMTVSGYLKSYHAFKQEAPPFISWSSSLYEYLYY